MNTTIAGITLASLESLRFFILLGILIVMLVIRFKKRSQVIKTLAAPRWQSLLLRHYSPVRALLKVALLIVGLSFLFFTLLHPQWGTSEETVKQQGRDLFIALDISRSMLAQDVKPNRLEAAKTKIKKLVRSLQSDRVGLLLFSGSAVVQCPLTTDYAAFFMALDALGPQTIGGGTTALDSVLQKLLGIFKTMPGKKNKIVALFTDGEDFSSNLGAIKQQAQQMGVTIFTIGVGTPQGAPVPIVDSYGVVKGTERDEKGAIVISPLNEGILHTLALDTGGQYLRMTSDNADIRTLRAAVDSYEKEQFEDKKITQLHEQYPYFLAVTFLCFALEWIL